MRVETLEYGGDPDSEYPVDAESFKVFTVWSEPVTESIDQIPTSAEIHESPEKSNVEPKRLVTAVEFGIAEGGYFFIESPGPNPEWLEKVFEKLKEKGWEGYGFREIRGNCRGEIEIQKESEWTAVFDKGDGRVFHNRGIEKGEGEIDDLEDFRSLKELKGLGAEVIRQEENRLKVKLFNGEKIWIKSRKELKEDLKGEETILKLLVVPGTEEQGVDNERRGIERVGEDKLTCKVVGKVTGYDVGDKWPEATGEHGYPLVELDVGAGKVVIAHENIPPKMEKQDYHKEGSMWKILARKLILKDLEKV